MDEHKELLERLIHYKFGIRELDFLHKKYGFCTICSNGKIQEFGLEEKRATVGAVTQR